MVLFYRPFKLEGWLYVYRDTWTLLYDFCFGPHATFFYMLVHHRGLWLCAICALLFFVFALSLSDLLCELGYHVVSIALAAMHVP